MDAASIRQHPFLRLVLPLCAGIVVGERLTLPYTYYYIGVLVLAALLVAVLLASRSRGRYAFAFAVNLFIASAGYLLSSVWFERSALPTGVDTYAAFKVKVREQPEEKPRTVLCTVVLEEAIDSRGDAVPLHEDKTVLAYIHKDSASMRIRQGDELLISSQIAKPDNSGISDGFDYARYLRLHGVAGRTFVRSDGWMTLGRQDSPTLLQRIQGFRYDIEALYRRLGIGGDNYSVLVAMTLGDKSDLSDNVRDAYSRAGVSHVLAMSGLHIGIVYGLLLLLMAPLWRRQPWLKPLLVSVSVALMWLFAVFTGLSASIVRSVTMFTLLSAASFMTEKPMSLNTLAVTAFVMLLCNPSWLFDVGFQLSMASVASILLFADKIKNFFGAGSNIVSWIAGSVAVSLAAQLGTAPIVAYYFHQFPVHFLLSNLLVVPMVTVIIYLAILMLASSPLPWLQGVLAKLTDCCLSLQNGVLDFIQHLPFASVGGIRINLLEVLLLYVILFFLYRFLRSHSAANVLRLLASVAVFLLWRLASAVFLLPLQP